MKKTLLVASVALLLASVAGSKTVFADDAAKAPPPKDGPPALEASTHCEVWTGSARGNEPAMHTALKLCDDGSRVKGELDITGDSSGWARYDVDGSWDAKHETLTVREDDIAEEHAKNGWKFCSGDWLLTRDTRPGEGGREALIGKFDAPSCGDHGNVNMTLAEAMRTSDARNAERPRGKYPYVIVGLSGPGNAPITMAKIAAGSENEYMQLQPLNPQYHLGVDRELFGQELNVPEAWVEKLKAAGYTIMRDR
jgi:hypothetical protein